jgi:transposase
MTDIAILHAHHPRLDPTAITQFPSITMPPEVGKLIVREYNPLDTHIAEGKMHLHLAKEHVKVNDFPCGLVKGGTKNGGEILALLQTVPGVGEITALIWLYTAVDPFRFPNKKALAAFTGCDPALKVSAGKVTSQTRRGGHKELHIALVQAAMGLVSRASEPLGRWGKWLVRGISFIRDLPRARFRADFHSVADFVCVHPAMYSTISIRANNGIVT